MDMLHRLSGPLHRGQRLPVDVCRFDSIYLLLKRSYLGLCLFKAVFVGLFAPQGSFRSYPKKKSSR